MNEAAIEPEPEPLLDTLASFARTAIEDPAALGLPTRDGVNDYDPNAAKSYAIDKLDTLIDLLNPAFENRETFAATLTILGRHLEERRQYMVIETEHDDPADETAYNQAGELITQALDLLDQAIEVLQIVCGNCGHTHSEHDEVGACKECNCSGWVES